MYNKKVCIVGAGGVGKTSLIQRFVDAEFDGGARSTLGARIDKKIVEIDGDKLQLMLWDIQGEYQLSADTMSYFKGASAIIYVVDGTRLETLGAAMGHKLEIETKLGQVLPSIVLFNKSDISDRWEVSNTMISDVEVGGMFSLLTSAKEGSGVNTAFNLLSRVLLGKTCMVAA